MSVGCVNNARREWGENGPLKWVRPSQAGRLEMSSPLIPRGTATENKWSLTPLFSQGPGSDLPLLQNTGWSTDVCSLATELLGELSSGLSTRHNGMNPPRSLISFDPRHRPEHGTLNGNADNSVALVAHRWPLSNWLKEVNRQHLMWLYRQ